MKWKQKIWNRKFGVVLSSVLLVLVVSFVAYSVYVPKLQELEKLKKELVRAKSEQNKLVMIGVPKIISEDDKKTLAAQVPVSLDQSRFLKALREEEKASGAVITNIQFLGDSEATTEKSTKDSKSTSKAPVAASKKKSVLTSSQGKLSVEGNYEQVRSFLEKFSNMSRLVTFSTWRLTTSEQVIATMPTTTTSGGSVVQIPGAQTQSQRPVPSPAGAPAQTNSTGVIVEEPGPKVTDADLTNEYLKDRSPIYEEKQMLRVLDLIKSDSFETDAERDMANLEMQHTMNRYMAGLLGLSEANSILDQEYANRFIDGANTNVRQVLGLPPAKKQVIVNQPAPAQGTPAQQTPVPETVSPAPVYLLTLPSTTVQGSRVVSTKVRIEITFTLYYVPGARFFPPPEPMDMYEPEQRSNPVESY